MDIFQSEGIDLKEMAVGLQHLLNKVLGIDQLRSMGSKRLWWWKYGKELRELE